jgi:hypothetical protein
MGSENSVMKIECGGFQTNLVTPDGKAGVPSELVLVTATGIESLHDIPRGFARV